jgi:hypothetical protein
MTVTDDPTQAVLAAAKRLVDFYGAGDIPNYLKCLAPDAMFFFHFHDDVLNSRDEWGEVLAGMAAEGVRVTSCKSTNQHVRLVSTHVAVFCHDVVTVQMGGTMETTLYEAETIVFELRNGVWVAVYEHLSERQTPEYSIVE